MNGLYWVYTWESRLDCFTPQNGVPPGPHNPYELRQALKALRAMGYGAHRRRDADGNHDDNDPFVLVVADSEKEGCDINDNPPHFPEDDED